MTDKMNRVESFTLPDCRDRCENGEANLLEVFIYDNEPAGESDELFRNQLREAIEYVLTSRQSVINKVSTFTTMRYWECECCGSLLVTLPQDSAEKYQCPQCKLSKCDHGGRYVEVAVDYFAKQSGIVMPNTQHDVRGRSVANDD